MAHIIIFFCVTLINSPDERGYQRGASIWTNAVSKSYFPLLTEVFRLSPQTQAISIPALCT